MILGKGDWERGVGVSEKGMRVAVIGVNLFEAVSAIIGAVGLVVGS